jgi:hypothetical protein
VADENAQGNTGNESRHERQENRRAPSHRSSDSSSELRVREFDLKLEAQTDRIVIRLGTITITAMAALEALHKFL